MTHAIALAGPSLDSPLYRKRNIGIETTKTMNYNHARGKFVKKFKDPNVRNIT